MNIPGMEDELKMSAYQAQWVETGKANRIRVNQYELKALRWELTVCRNDKN